MSRASLECLNILIVMLNFCSQHRKPNCKTPQLLKNILIEPKHAHKQACKRDTEFKPDRRMNNTCNFENQPQRKH